MNIIKSFDDYQGLIQSGVNQIFIIICTNENTHTYLKTCEELFLAHPLPYQIASCSDSLTLTQIGITTVPSIKLVSHPSHIDEVLQIHPIELFSQLEKIQEEYVAFLSNQSKSYSEKIAKLIKENPIIMFIVGTPEKPMCRFTSKLIQKLQPFHIKFAFYDLEADKLMVNYLKEFSKWPTFPQVFIQGNLIGGCDSVLNLIETKQLSEIIPKEALMSQATKLQQIQLLSKHIVLIDGIPDQTQPLAVILTERKIPFQFYNIKLDQEIRTEILNKLSLYVDTSHNLEPLLLFKNTIYDYPSIIKEIETNELFME